MNRDKMIALKFELTESLATATGGWAAWLAKAIPALDAVIAKTA